MTGEGKQISVGIVSLGAVALTEPDSGFPVGGAEVQLYTIAERLAKSGDFAVTLYVADVGQAHKDADGVSVKPLCTLGPNRKLRAISTAGVVWSLARARHDVYVTQSASGINGVAALAARWARGAYLHMCAHDSEATGLLDSTLSGRATWLHRVAVRLADALTCQSSKQAADLRRAFHREATIVPNFPPATLAVPQNDRERHGLLWVGRDVDWKQPELFIELARRLPEHPFTMVCQPQVACDVQRLTRDAPANLRLFQGLPFVETRRLFARNHVLVCTSTVEGYPTVFLEAGTAGTPIISLTVDPGNIIERYNAGRVCNGSFDKLLASAQEILSQPALWNDYHEGAILLAETEGERADTRMKQILYDLRARRLGVRAREAKADTSNGNRTGGER